MEMCIKESVRHASFCLLMRGRQVFQSGISITMSFNLELWSKSSQEELKVLLTVEHMEMSGGVTTKPAHGIWNKRVIIFHCLPHMLLIAAFMSSVGLPSVKYRQRKPQKTWTVPPNSCRIDVPSHFCSYVSLALSLLTPYGWSVGAQRGAFVGVCQHLPLLSLFLWSPLILPVGLPAQTLSGRLMLRSYFLTSKVKGERLVLISTLTGASLWPLFFPRSSSSLSCWSEPHFFGSSDIETSSRSTGVISLEGQEREKCFKCTQIYDNSKC